jgi:hypothetical protein
MKMIPSEIVARYVAACRTPRRPGMFSDVLSQMMAGFNSRSSLDPNLDTLVTYHLVKTAQRTSEIFQVGERYLILFDSGQLEHFARMNYAFLSQDDSVVKAVAASEVIEQAAVLGDWDIVSTLLPLRQNYMSGWRSNHKEAVEALQLTERQAAFLLLHELAHVHVERETCKAEEARRNVDAMHEILKASGEQLLKDAEVAERAFQQLISSAKVQAELEQMDAGAKSLGHEMLQGVRAAGIESRYLAELFLRPPADFVRELICDTRAVIDTALMFWSEDAARKWDAADRTANESEFAMLSTALLVAVQALSVHRFLLHISHEAASLSPLANIAYRTSAQATVRMSYARLCLRGMWLRAVHLATGRVPENAEKRLQEFFEGTGKGVAWMNSTPLNEFYEDVLERLSAIKEGVVPDVCSASQRDELVQVGFQDLLVELSL